MSQCTIRVEATLGRRSDDLEAHTREAFSRSSKGREFLERRYRARVWPCAAITQLGFLCKHRGASAAPRVELRAPLRSARDLFRSRWFAIGMAIAAVAFALHVAALAVAPLSVVQVSLSTGVVMLAVMGERLFGCKVGSRQWIGVIMTATGLTLLVLHAAAHRR